MRSRSLPQPPTRTASTISGRSSNLMNAAKPADGLLSGGQTIALLETLGKSVNGMTEEQAARDMGVQRAASYARSEEHTSELQSLMRISSAVFCLKKKTQQIHETHH